MAENDAPDDGTDPATIVPRKKPVSNSDPMIGKDLGAYRIEARIGGGGMGDVYKAVDRRLGRAVAIKVLAENLAKDEDAQKRFQNEARAAARLNHPHVVTIHEVGQHQKRPFLVMEMVPGGSTHDQVTARGRCSWREASRMIADACRGLAAAHEAGLIHRDIKPSNLMCGVEGIVKLADFGIAKATDSTGTALTRTGHIIGTPDFMSPEQCRAQSLEARSDIYSLGATYYYLLTGQHPYPVADPIQVMFAHCSRPTPDPRKIAPDVPAECAAIVSKAMAKKRSDRYPDARAMLADLDKLLRNLTPPDNAHAITATVTPRPVPKSGPRTGARRVNLAIVTVAVLAAVLAVLLAFAAGWFFRNRVLQPALNLPKWPIDVRVRKVMHELTGEVRTVRISRDGRLMVSAGSDAFANVVMLPAGEPHRVLAGQQDKIYCAAFSPDSRLIATGANDRSVCLWNAQTGVLLTRELADAIVWDVAFTADGKQLVAAVGYTGLTVFDLNVKISDPTDIQSAKLTIKKSLPLDGHLANGLAAAHDRGDRREIAAIIFGRNVRVLEAPAFGEKDALSHRIHAHSAAFIPGTDSLVVGCDGPLLHWTPGEAPKTLAENQGTISTVATTPDGKIFLYGGTSDSTLRLKNAAGDGQRLIRDVGRLRSLAVSPDGKTLVSGSFEKGEVKLWDIIEEQ